MTLQSYLVLTPTVASVFWLLFYLLFASKDTAYRCMKQFLTVTSLFLIFTLLSEKEDAFLLLHFILFKQVCALLMIPYFLKYIKSLQGLKPTGTFYTLLMVAPYVQLIVGIESVFSIGYENAVGIIVDSFTFQGPMFPYLPDNSQKIFYACYTYMFKTVLLADFMLFSINLMKCAVTNECSLKEVFAFFFKKVKAPIKPIQYFVAMLLFLVLVSGLILGKSVSDEKFVLSLIGSILIAVFVSFLALAGTVGKTKYQSIPGILRSVKFGKKDDDDDVLEPEADQVTEQPRAAEEPAIHYTDSQKEDALDKLRESIALKLDRYLVEEKLYLKHDITLVYVADKLGVFKEELSDYISYKYDMSFQNYINMLRITYAEKYLMAHDRVTQNEIAMECGFSGASSFNSAFSKKNGVTPKIWKDRQLELLKNQEV